MTAVVSIVETAVCRCVTKGSGYSEFCLATGRMELSPGPRSMGLSLKRGPSYDTEWCFRITDRHMFKRFLCWHAFFQLVEKGQGQFMETF